MAIRDNLVSDLKANPPIDLWIEDNQFTYNQSIPAKKETPGITEPIEWEKIESDERFQSLDPLKKLEVLDEWRADTASFLQQQGIPDDDILDKSELFYEQQRARFRKEATLGSKISDLGERAFGSAVTSTVSIPQAATNIAGRTLGDVADIAEPILTGRAAQRLAAEQQLVTPEQPLGIEPVVAEGKTVVGEFPMEAPERITLEDLQAAPDIAKKQLQGTRIRETGLKQGAKDLGEFKEELQEYYKPNPLYNGTWTGIIASAAGSSIPTLISSLPSGGMSVASNALQLYQESFDQNIRAGADPDEAHMAGLLNMGGAGLEKFGDIRLADTIKDALTRAYTKAAGTESFTKWVLKKGGKILSNSASEAAVESAQTGWQQLLNNEILETAPQSEAERKQEIVQAAVGGGGVGGGVTALSTASEGLDNFLRRQEQKQRVQKITQTPQFKEALKAREAQMPQTAVALSQQAGIQVAKDEELQTEREQVLAGLTTLPTEETEDAPQEQSTAEIPLRQETEAGEGVRTEDEILQETPGQKAPQAGVSLVSTALKYKDTVVPGTGLEPHANVTAAAVEQFIDDPSFDPNAMEYGFVDSEGQFHNREQALPIAQQAGQLPQGYTPPASGLQSQDLIQPTPAATTQGQQEQPVSEADTQQAAQYFGLDKDLFDNGFPAYQAWVAEREKSGYEDVSQELYDTQLNEFNKIAPEQSAPQAVAAPEIPPAGESATSTLPEQQTQQGAIDARRKRTARQELPSDIYTPKEVASIQTQENALTEQEYEAVQKQRIEGEAYLNDQNLDAQLSGYQGLISNPGEYVLNRTKNRLYKQILRNKGAKPVSPKLVLEGTLRNFLRDAGRRVTTGATTLSLNEQLPGTETELSETISTEQPQAGIVTPQTTPEQRVSQRERQRIINRDPQGIAQSALSRLIPALSADEKLALAVAQNEITLEDGLDRASVEEGEFTELVQDVKERLRNEIANEIDTRLGLERPATPAGDERVEAGRITQLPVSGRAAAPAESAASRRIQIPFRRTILNEFPFQELKEDYGFDQGTEAVLQRVADLARENPDASENMLALAALAEQLAARDLGGLKINIVETAPAEHMNDAAVYNARDHSITIFADNNVDFQNLQQNILHEVIHAATYRTVRMFERGETSNMSPELLQSVKDLQSVYFRTRFQLAGEAVTERSIEGPDFPRELYGLQDMHEFMTEALTNPEFQAFLASLPSDTPNKSLWDQFLDALKRFLSEFLDLEMDNNVLSEAVDNIVNLIELSPTPGPVQYNERGEIMMLKSLRNTEALLRARSTMAPEVQEILSRQEKIPNNRAEDLESANEVIGQYRDLREAKRAVDESTDLTETQKLLANAMIAKKYGDMQKAVAKRIKKPKKGDNVAELKALEQEYNNAQVAITTPLMDTGSRAGQLLQLFNNIADIFAPRTFSRQYTDPILSVQKDTLKTDKTSRDIETTLVNSKDEGADKAVDENKEVINELTKIKRKRKPKKQEEGSTESGATKRKPSDKIELPPKNILDPMQAMFDFMDMVVRKPFSVLPVTTDIQNSVAKGVTNQVLTAMGIKERNAKDKGFLDALEKQIRGIVESQINQQLPETEGPSEDTRRTNVKNLIDSVSKLELAEKAFNQTIASIRTQYNADPSGNAALAPYIDLVFDPLSLDGVMEAVRDNIDLKNAVRRSLKDQNASLESVIETIASETGLTPEQAEPVAKLLKRSYESAARKEAQKQLDNLTKEKPATAKVVKSRQDKLLELLNLGAFTTEKYYNAIADAYNLPTWDENFAKEIEAEAERIQEMEEGSIGRNEDTVRLMAKIAAEQFRTAKGKKKLKNIFDTGTAVWLAGVLSGPPTWMVNAIYTQANVLMELGTLALGYSEAAKKEGLSDASKFFQDITTAYYQAMGRGGFNSKSALEAKSALRTGQARMRSDRLEDLSVLENFTYNSDKPWSFNNMLSLYKYVGRIMGATDAFNAITAREASLIMGARYAAMKEGLEGKELQEYMDKFADQNSERFQRATKIADAEMERGDFGNTEGLEPNSKAFKRKQSLIELNYQRRVNQLVENEVTTKESREAAGRFMEQATFNNKPYGMIGLIMDGIINQANKQVPVLRFVFPFMRTMANLLNASLNWSPYGYARAFGLNTGQLKEGGQYWKEPPVPGSAEYYQALWKAHLGTVFVGTVLAGMASGLIEVTADGPEDRNKKKNLMDSGTWEPYTIKIGPVRFRYNDMPAINLILGAFGALSDAEKYNNVPDRDMVERMMRAGLGIVEVVINKNAMQGASDIFDIISGDTSAIYKTERLAGNIVGGFTNPSMLRFVRNIGAVGADGKVQRTDPGFLVAITPSVFGIGKPKLNILGEPVRQYPWEALSYRFATIPAAKTHPILTPLVDKGLFLPVPDKSTRIALEENGEIKNRKMSPEEFYEFSQYYGEAMKEWLTPEVVEELTSSETEAAQDWLHGKLREHARNTARFRLVEKLEAKRTR